MRNLGSAALAALVAGGALASTPALAGSRADEAAIQALEMRFAAAFAARDLDGVMKAYAPGKDLVVFDVVPPREYVGWDAYRADWKTTLAGFKGPINVKISELKIETSAPLAYSRSIQHVSGTGVDGQPRDLTVRVTDVYRKIGGHWLIVHEHVSVPVDLATGKADLASKP
jgi:ketosteroid isomerase-like protein